MIGILLARNSQTFFLLLFFSSTLPEKTGAACPHQMEVFVGYPPARLFRMPSFSPSPEQGEDSTVYLTEGSLAGHMPVIVGPSLDDWVEADDQVSGCDRRVFLHDFSDLLQD
jgi:hypothetical protein